MKWIKDLFKKTYEIRYCRIRKPKKDEIIIFKMPDYTGYKEMEQFSEVLKRCKKEENPYLIMTGPVEITKVKKKNVSIKR